MVCSNIFGAAIQLYPCTFDNIHTLFRFLVLSFSLSLSCFLSVSFVRVPVLRVICNLGVARRVGVVAPEVDSTAVVEIATGVALGTDWVLWRGGRRGGLRRGDGATLGTDFVLGRVGRRGCIRRGDCGAWCAWPPLGLDLSLLLTLRSSVYNLAICCCPACVKFVHRGTVSVEGGDLVTSRTAGSGLEWTGRIGG